MRPILLGALLPAFMGAAPALELVRPIIAQSDGGVAEPAGFEHVPGETLFFTCRVAGYSKSTEDKVHLVYSVEALDPKGVLILEPYKNELITDVAPQDKEWMPKIQTEVQIPPLVGSGAYKLVIKAEDVVAKTAAQLEVPFQVRGHDVAPSATLVARNFRFYRGEDDLQPLEKPVYRPGDGVWARFDITGFRYGEKNRVEVSYVTSVIGASGNVLWTQPEPATEQSESFYPKRYVAASMGISLTSTVRPGEYTIAVRVKDAVGNQSCEIRQKFTVQ
jgi:hypothetical protein